LIRTPEAIAKQKQTLADNKAREIERRKKREERKLARTVGIRAPVLPLEPRRPSALFIDVDWQNIPMAEAQGLYARMKDAFEVAGRILNARAMPEGEFYVCYMAGKPKCCKAGTLFRRPARFRDYENGPRDPKTGLVTPVEICGENCSIRYNDLLITARRERNMIPRTS